MAASQGRLSWPVAVAAIALEIVGVAVLALGTVVFVVALLRQRADPPR